jgi:molybdate transport system permease protein
MDLWPILLTLKLACIVTIALLAIGIPLAYWLAFTERRFKPLIEIMVSMPLVLPPTVLGFYILLTFSPASFLGRFLESWFNIRVVFTFLGLVIGSMIFSLPFMVNPIKAGFQSLPKSLSEASYTLGKSKTETLLRVLLPNVRPSILSAAVMTFAHTVGEFGVVLMVGGNIPGVTRLASIAIYGEVETLNYSAAHFYSFILLITSFSVLSILYLANKKVRLNL